jgi:nitric oxide reductase NorQ protein
VVLHPLTDDRRLLPLDRTGELLEAPDDFMLVVSYNPGYQNVLKQLKPSTRQRFVAIEFDFPPAEVECAVVSEETGLDADRVGQLVRLAGRLRAMKGHDLEEGVSTRLLVYCATLIKAGLGLREAVQAAMIEPLTDDLDVKKGLDEVVLAVFG